MAVKHLGRLTIPTQSKTLGFQWRSISVHRSTLMNRKERTKRWKYVNGFCKSPERLCRRAKKEEDTF